MHKRIAEVLARFGVDPNQGPVDRLTSTETLIGALDEACASPLIDALCDIDCCCACCDEHRDVLTRLAGGTVHETKGT